MGALYAKLYGYFPPSSPTAPSQVKNLQLLPGTLSGSLRASWSAGAGDVDFYTVFLLWNARVEIVRRVPKQDNRTDFEDLIPGQLYTVRVQTVSGTLTNDSTISRRTGEMSRINPVSMRERVTNGVSEKT